MYPLHHLLIALLCLYLAWVFFAAGHLIIGWFNGHKLMHGIDGLDAAIARCFLGISSVQLFVIVLGFSGLLYESVAIAFTAVFFFFSWPLLLTSKSQFRVYLKNSDFLNRENWVEWALAILLCIIAGYVFFSKVIFPTFDWDTIMHYNQYFAEVVRNHNLNPNNVWYHYFYSKGAGAFILGILLSDQDGHKLITYISLVYACMALWSLLATFNSRKISLAFMLAYLGIYVSNDAWYIFDKQHVMMSCMITGLLWAGLRYSTAYENTKHVWMYVSIFMVIATIVFVPTTVGILLPVYGLVTLFNAWNNRRTEAIHYGTLMLTALLTIVVWLAINYISTGMFEITPVEPNLNVADQKVLSQWTSPYMALWMIEGFPHKLTSFFSSSLNIKELQAWAVNLLHIDELLWLKHLKYLIVACVFCYLAQPSLFSIRKLDAYVRLIAAILMVIGFGFAFSLTMNQPISIARYFIFTTPLILLIVTTSIVMITERTIHETRHNAIYLVFTLLVVGNIHLTPPDSIPKRSVLGFAFGTKTYKDAYDSKSLFSEDALTASRLTNPDDRIMSSNPMHQSYAIAGRPMEVELNYSYHDWHTMVFDQPAAARAAYKKEGIKYFYFDFTYPVNGMMPFSPLLYKDSVLSNLYVVWHSKNAYLLGWCKPHDAKTTDSSDGEQNCAPNDNAHHAVEKEFIKRLSDNKKHNVPGENIYRRIKLYWDRNAGEAFPVTRDLSLPDVKGLY